MFVIVLSEIRTRVKRWMEKSLSRLSLGDFSIDLAINRKFDKVFKIDFHKSAHNAFF